MNNAEMANYHSGGWMWMYRIEVISYIFSCNISFNTFVKIDVKINDGELRHL